VRLGLNWIPIRTRGELEAALPVIDELHSRGGWGLKLHMAVDLGLSKTEMDEYLELLEATNEVETVDLSRHTLIVLSSVDTREAIAELSDIKEAQWRQTRGESLPPLDDRAPDDG